MSDFKLGEHEGRLGAIEASLKSIDEKVDALVAADQRRQGAWKIVAAAGGLAGAVVAFVGSIIKAALFPDG